MANENKQPTQEEIEKKRYDARESALKTFGSNVVDLAAAFYVENSGQYGEAGASAVDQYIYGPAIRDNTEIIFANLLGSRQGKKRYTGNVSEWSIIQNAAKIVNESLGAISIPDVLNLMGSEAELRDELKQGYMGDYLNSQDENTKKFAQGVASSYLTYLTDMKVSEALSRKAKAGRGALEDIVQKEEPKKK
jgi:hypothetical protein